MFKYISDNPPAFNNGVDFNISAVVQSLVASVANVVVSKNVKQKNCYIYLGCYLGFG